MNGNNKRKLDHHELAGGGNCKHTYTEKNNCINEVPDATSNINSCRVRPHVAPPKDNFYNDKTTVTTPSSLERPLNDDVLRIILQFVGLAQYLWVAPVNRQFYRVYKNLFGPPRTALATCGETSPYSIERAQQYLQRTEKSLSRKHYDSADLFRQAASHGNLPLVRWLWHRDQQQVQWIMKHQSARMVAKNGHLPILKWLYANGCYMNGWVCRGAAEFGHLAILRWLRSVGCIWDHQTWVHAVQGGHLYVLEWACANKCEGLWCPPRIEELKEEALTLGHTHIDHWLDELLMELLAERYWYGYDRSGIY